MPSVASCALILLIVASLQPTILILLREVQPLNMLSILVTRLVFQPLKSKVVSLLQLENMLFMLVTLLVFQPLKSREVREVLLNMLLMLVTPSNFATGILQLPLASGVTVYLVPFCPPHFVG